MTTTITPELIRSALTHISANLHRDEWVRVGMAVHSEYPDDTGRDLFTEWSATAEGYDLKGAATTWKGFKSGSGVGIGTLLHLAKQNGFTLPTAGHAPSTPDHATLAQKARERAAHQQAANARIDTAQAAAAVEAVTLWEQAGINDTTGTSPYLTRKGVQPHGVRFASGGWLLVPMRDEAGNLLNLQRIAPTKPTDGPDKLFQKGGRKSGLWHLLGDVADIGAVGAGVPAVPTVILVGEGYATAASLHEATGHPVAVAFDAGNLPKVAKALRKLHPASLLVLCGDDDLQTFAATGKNPGRDSAVAAARAVGGVAVFPAPLADGESDFNDLHQAHGLDAVRAIVDAAIDAAMPAHRKHLDKQATAKAAKHATSPKMPQNRTQPHTSNAADTTDAATHTTDSAPSRDRFHVDESGVLFTPPGDDDAKARHVCGPLRVTGLARDASDNQAALLLEFDTQFGKSRKWLMPLTMLSGDGTAYRSALLSQGFMAPTDTKRRGWLTEYLQSRRPSELVRHVPRVGWHGRCYVLPEETLGTNPNGERVIFHSEAGIEANFSKRGTLAQWQQDLARLCVGNTRAAFAVATAFAGPLLAWAGGTTGGGFHYTGATSIGKTTGFLIAASVWGKGTEKDPDSFMQKWRATSNGLEFQGEQHNDCTLILDELGQMDANDAGNAAYMLADGMGKTRGKSAGGLRAKPTWRLLFLSSGELTLAQHMETVGKKMKGGQEVRLIPIPAEVAPGSALENNHEFEGGHELSGHVQTHAARYYGTAGRAWLEYLVNNVDGLTAKLRTRMDAIELQLCPETAAGQVKRGARRFALVAAAGEIATEAGLTGWPAGEATKAATACFNAWLESRGGAGSSETTAMLRAVRSFLVAHQEGRFTYWHRAGDDHAAKTLNKAGVRRMLGQDGTPIKSNSDHQREYGDKMHATDGESVSYEYYVLADTFRDEVCRGLDLTSVCKVLLSHACLTVKEEGRYNIKTKLPGIGAARCYLIPPAIFALDL